MNKIYNLIIVLLALAAGMGLQQGYAQEVEAVEALDWNYTDMRIVRLDGGKEVEISFTAQPTRPIRSTEIVYLYPSFVSQDGKHQKELSGINVVGANRAKAIKRAEVLKNKVNLPPRVALYTAKQLPIKVKEVFPYESWMSKGQLAIRQEVYGCAECKKKEGDANLMTASLRVFSPEDYSYHYIEPQAEAFKRYEESFQSKVNFVVAKHDLLKNFKNNASELKRLDDFVSKALDLVGATLDKIEVEGYASPEGEFNSNKALAERRANVLAKYVKDKFPHVRKAPSFSVKGIGEDWDGLRKAVSESEMAYRDQILTAIDSYNIDTDREARIKALDGGRVYRYLLDNLYPPLRRTTFRMGYAVRAFKVEELPDIYRKKPELMSHQEYFLLAQKVKADGEDPTEIYAQAHKRFTEDPLAAYNYANALLEYQQDARKALALLSSLTMGDEQVAYPTAIAYHMLGNEAEATAWLQRAAKARNQQAKEVLGF